MPEKILTKYEINRRDLIELHDQLKAFPRMELYDRTLLGTWRCKFSEYLTMFCKMVGCMSYVGMVDHNLPDWWAHDVISTLGIIRNIYITEGFWERHRGDIIPDINITREEFYSKTGLYDIDGILLWLEAVLMDVHHYIEFGESDCLHGVLLSPVTAPRHNGYYYRWPCEFRRVQNGWKPQGFLYIAPLPRQK